MTKAATPAVAKSMKQSSKKKATSEAPQLDMLATAAQKNIEKYTKVKNTAKSYTQNINRLRMFLASQIADRQARGITICEEGILIDELAKALDNPPNQYSAIVLERYITQKCFIDGRKKGVAESAHAAGCRYWDIMDGDKYAGEYKFDEKTNQVSGCPARAPCVLQIKKAVQTRGKNDGATRNHAEAITREDMKKLMQWSERMCSDERLKHLQHTSTGGNNGRPFEEAKGPGEPLTVEEIRLMFEHGFMRAFSTSAFTVWMRCFEGLSITVADISLNCVGRAPYFTPHFKLNLNNRKGWQNAQGYDGERRNNTYEIYPQNVPEIDMHSHLLRWLKVLAVLLGRELKPTDHVFPHISPNGTIDPTAEMSYDSLMKLLKKYTTDAGIERRITSHSFRRGGAQDRFVHAIPALRWSLHRTRWWGGWAEGENVDTLMKYLIDSLQSYENSHADALHPVPSTGHDPGFFGEYNKAAPVTAGEVRELKRSVDKQMDSLDRNIERRMEDMVNQITSRLGSTHLPVIPNYPERRVANSVRTAAAPYPPRASSVSTNHSDSISSDDALGAQHNMLLNDILIIL